LRAAQRAIILGAPRLKSLERLLRLFEQIVRRVSRATRMATSDASSAAPRTLASSRARRQC